MKKFTNVAKNIGFLLSILVGIGLINCAAGTFGTVVTPEMEKHIVKGKTKKAEVLNLLGNPNQVIDMEDNKQQLSYISQKRKSYPYHTTAKNTEFWIILENDIVVDYGRRPTNKPVNYFN